MRAFIELREIKAVLSRHPAAVRSRRSSERGYSPPTSAGRPSGSPLTSWPQPSCTRRPPRPRLRVRRTT
jgi:hypothetical protein